MSQMAYVILAYAIGLGGVLVLLLHSFIAMTRAERHAERLRAERRR